MTASWVDLAARILADVPRLPGRAACRDHLGTFDAAADGDRTAADAAVAICATCPVLAACGEWIATARRPPPGVWAAQFTPPTTKRK